MDFTEALKEYTAGDLIEHLGCPPRTAYNWKAGERQPPEWLQPIILEALASRKKAAAKS